jgi:hypothetical protein
MKQINPLIILILVLAMILVPAIAGQLDKPDGLRFDVQGDTAFVDGTSTSRSQNAVRRLLRDNPQVNRLVFRSMPGTIDVTTNYHLARTIRDAGLTTELTATSRIASGAVDLFLAGERRIVACGAMIGVHAWGSTGYDAQDVMFDPHRGMSRRFLSDMGVDPDFYDFRTEMAGTEDIHWMSNAEIARWGVATEPRPDCE